MISFGKKIALLRKEKDWSQTELATHLGTSVSVVSRYERDEMTPSIEVAKRLADLLGTTVGYLLGETQESGLLRHPEMLRRLADIASFGEKEREHIYFTLDALIRDIKNRKAYAA